MPLNLRKLFCLSHFLKGSKGFLKVSNATGMTGFLAIVMLFYYYLVRGFRNWIIRQKINTRTEAYLYLFC